MCDIGNFSHVPNQLANVQPAPPLRVVADLNQAAAAGPDLAKGKSPLASSSAASAATAKKSRKSKKPEAAAPAAPVAPKPQYVLVVADSDDERRHLSAQVYTKFQPATAGGLQLVDEEELKMQRGVVWEIVKAVGNRIAEGMELRDIGMPIQLLAPCSFLQAMSKAWAFAPKFLSAAAATSDPVVRLKNVICFAISGMHLSASYRKPFNPILGETYQARFSDGAQVYLEQTSHHPPASNWQLVGPANSYMFWGRGVGSASARGNMIRGYQHGPNVVDFADGTRITWNLPVLVVQGIAWGDRIQHFDGVLSFSDLTHDLHADIQMNAEALGFIKGLFSKPKEKTDYLRGDITVGTGKTAKTVCKVEGSWLSHLDFNDERLWDKNRDLPYVCRAVEDEAQLPSDCSRREDLIAIGEGDMQRGSECKQMLEDRQRYDKRLRQKGAALRR